ncbi:MAG: hypothetical protein ACKPE8_09075, partial [Dolichospermum sp.]
LLVITHYPLPITHYPLPITHYPLPITHYPLPITHYPLPITHYLLLQTFQNCFGRTLSRNCCSFHAINIILLGVTSS